MDRGSTPSGLTLLESHCISLHCNLNQRNLHLINNFTMKQMRQGAFLVNAAHCGPVDEKDLVRPGPQGRQDRRGGPRGAPIGAFQLCLGSLERCTESHFTPHTVWYSEQASLETREATATEISWAVTGLIPESLRNCANKEFFVTTAPVQ